MYSLGKLYGVGKDRIDGNRFLTKELGWSISARANAIGEQVMRALFLATLLIIPLSTTAQSRDCDSIFNDSPTCVQLRELKNQVEQMGQTLQYDKLDRERKERNETTEAEIKTYEAHSAKMIKDAENEQEAQRKRIDEMGRDFQHSFNVINGIDECITVNGEEYCKK